MSSRVFTILNVTPQISCLGLDKNVWKVCLILWFAVTAFEKKKLWCAELETLREKIHYSTRSSAVDNRRVRKLPVSSWHLLRPNFTFVYMSSEWRRAIGYYILYRKICYYLNYFFASYRLNLLLPKSNFVSIKPKFVSI